MADKLTAVKGMNDILPPDSARWEALEAAVRQVMRLHAYRNIRTPIVEPTALFVRGLGEVTDIVEKEMYSFEDRLNGEQLTLRPESTAGVVRAVVEHNLLYEGGKRLYYMGPMFRHERPQRGRYRQFHQIGAEALGFGGPEVDAELILLAVALWQALGLKHVRLELNSLGQPPERLQHRAALIAYFDKAGLDTGLLNEYLESITTTAGKIQAKSIYTILDNALNQGNSQLALVPSGDPQRKQNLIIAAPNQQNDAGNGLNSFL
jgi:histidyl-tRNA synthetase